MPGLKLDTWIRHSKGRTQPWKNTRLSKAGRWTVCWARSFILAPLLQGSLRPVLLRKAVLPLIGAAGDIPPSYYNRFQMVGMAAAGMMGSRKVELLSGHLGLSTRGAVHVFWTLPRLSLHRLRCYNYTHLFPPQSTLGALPARASLLLCGFSQAGSL